MRKKLESGCDLAEVAKLTGWRTKPRFYDSKYVLFSLNYTWNVEETLEYFKKATVIFSVSRTYSRTYCLGAFALAFPLLDKSLYWRLFNDLDITCLEKLFYYTLSKEATRGSCHTVTLPCFNSLKILLLKVWSTHHQHWHHLRVYKKCRISTHSGPDDSECTF